MRIRRKANHNADSYSRFKNTMVIYSVPENFRLSHRKVGSRSAHDKIHLAYSLPCTYLYSPSEVARNGLFLFGWLDETKFFALFCMVSEELHKLVEECSAVYSAHVIDIAIRGSQHRSIVEIFVDAENGITTDVCSEISRAVAEQLETRNMFKNSYELVVSSPGIDRPLRFPWQYKKHIGRKLELRVQKQDSGSVLTGKLLNVNDEGVTLQVGKAGEEVAVPFSSIQQAIVKSPW